MDKKRKKFMISFVLSFLFLSLLSFSLEMNVSASVPPVCKNSDDDDDVNTVQAIDDLIKIDDDLITIQCSPKNQWAGIRSNATYSNVKGSFVNYSNTGGYAKARRDFDSMPGRVTVNTNERMIKDTGEGLYLTLYRSTHTSTNPWSLQYPRSLISGTYDKIRYYEGSFIPIEP